jgi:chromate transport protein ChrA
MSNEYRYRKIPPTFSRLLSFAFFFLLAVSISNVVIGGPLLVTLSILFGAYAATDAGFVLGVVAFVVTQLAAMMGALWGCMKWGRYSGAELQFVRPNLVDIASAGKA